MQDDLYDGLKEEVEEGVRILEAWLATPFDGGRHARAVESAEDTLRSRFEKALEELEALVARMEDGKLPLEESLAAYQRGVYGEIRRWAQKVAPAALHDDALQAVAAMLLAVGDAFSAMTTTRPYRKALDIREALRRLEDAGAAGGAAGARHVSSGSVQGRDQQGRIGRGDMRAVVADEGGLEDEARGQQHEEPDVVEERGHREDHHADQDLHQE